MATDKTILKSIKSSLDRASLERKFEEYNVLSKTERVKYMLKAMGNPAISYSCGKPAIAEKYEILLGSFLIGFWRKNRV